MLRIDVDNPSDRRNYGIPPGNPYVGNDRGFREEIYAYGLRNPWRLSIDPATGDIWVGDVGERDWEEVDIIEKGGNYGWPIMEGNECFNASECDEDGLVAPVAVYDHPEEHGASVTGGHVYRGEMIPELKGTYVFGDWVSTDLFLLDYYGDGSKSLTRFEANDEQRIALKHYPSFGTDKNGELYYLSIYHGSIHRIAPGTEAGKPDDPPSVTETTFKISGPNPTADRTSVTFEVRETGPVRVALYDALGRRVAMLHDRVVSGGTVRQLQIPVGALPGGTYFCRMTGRDFSRTRTVILLR